MIINFLRNTLAHYVCFGRDLVTWMFLHICRLVVMDTHSSHFPLARISEIEIRMSSFPIFIEF